jgi:disulfide bond formation protein DsbB
MSAAAWHRLRRIAYAVYAAVLVAIVIVDGIPTGRTTIAVLIVVGLLLTSVGHGWRRAAQVVIDWLPFTAVLLLYDRTRGVADSLGIGLHERDVLHAEKWLFGGTEPTVWLQQHLYHPAHVYWYDALCTLVYSSHFLTTPILAAVLWLRDRTAWLRYISRVIVLSVAGLVTYCVFPEAPPWLAAHDGLSAPVARLSARGFEWLHLGDVKETLARAQNDGSNPVAAMPSLHCALAVLAALTIAARLRSRWRYLLALYPVAMGFTLVYTGEHYVLDLLVGLAYALIVHWGVCRWEARRARRSGRSADEGAVADPVSTPAR